MGASFSYFAKLWLEVDCIEGHIFLEEDLAGYEEPVALTELAEHAVGPLAARIRQLRALSP